MTRVKKAEKQGRNTQLERWKMPLSSEMADAALDLMQRAEDFRSRTQSCPADAANPLLLSALPTPQTLLKYF
jgi:hypothetical protein